MIRDLLRDLPEANIADVLIVGAGAAGILLAVELTRKGKRVTLLEAGGAGIEEESQDPYRSEIAGLLHKGVHVGRVRAKGGTTTKWGGQILELQEIDFAARPWVQGSGWPIEKRELTPFYARALELEGLGATLRDDPAVWRALGLPMPTYGSLEPYFSRWCPEPNFARVHAAALEAAAGPDVWLHANVVDLLLDDERAVGVRCRTLTGVEAVFRAERYVFCMGAIESARFFLQPRPAGLPWNRSGLLGRHFQDHLDGKAATVVPLDARRFHEAFDNVFLHGIKYHPKLRLKAELQAERKTLNAAAAMHFESDVDQALAANKATAKHLLRGRFGELQASDVGALLRHLPVLTRQAMRYAVEHRAWNPPGARISLFVYCEQEPEGASSITLGQDRDALGLLRTKIDWRIADSEVDTIRQCVGAAKDGLAGLAEVIADPALVAGDPGFLDRCGDSNHHMGGMRMAVSESAGVVDTNLRLFGTRNVYIGSAAVFPTSGNSNPTHTLLALALRLAEHLG